MFLEMGSAIYYPCVSRTPRGIQYETVRVRVILFGRLPQALQPCLSGVQLGEPTETTGSVWCVQYFTTVLGFNSLPQGAPGDMGDVGPEGDIGPLVSQIAFFPE